MNDLPITNMEDDLYGFEPFANTIATSVKKMAAPEGVVTRLSKTGENFPHHRLYCLRDSFSVGVYLPACCN